MFTQCPKCETVFRLAAEALRAAGGQVRCGRCGEVFNALARLAEHAGGFSKGESSYELESRAEEILEFMAPAEEREFEADGTPEAATEIAAAPGIEVAHLQFVDPPHDELEDESSLEFTLPPGDLDRIFIETRPNLLHQLSSETHRERRKVEMKDAAATAPASEDIPLHVIPLHIVPQPAAPTPAERVPTDRAHPLLPEGAAALAAHHTSEEHKAAPYPTIARDLHEDLSAKPGVTMLSRYSTAAGWLGGAVALGVLLLVQVLRGHGGWLAAHAPSIASGEPSASLGSYQLRQWGVTADPAAKGTLRLRASIMNTAAQLQPYPLLRVSLANRFGAHLGAREFEPAEYLGTAPRHMLAPGERVDAALDILDPGGDAEGFEIDVCVRGAGRKIACAGDAAGQAK